VAAWIMALLFWRQFGRAMRERLSTPSPG